MRIDFGGILRTLADHGVQFIVVGGVAAALHGSPVSTFDVDIVHARNAENVTKRMAALDSLDAHYRLQPERRLRPVRSMPEKTQAPELAGEISSWRAVI
ncbi:MAG: hypothetical protein ABI693_08865 [Bryobacteraceae bacterium]